MLRIVPVCPKLCPICAAVLHCCSKLSTHRFMNIAQDACSMSWCCTWPVALHRYAYIWVDSLANSVKACSYCQTNLLAHLLWFLESGNWIQMQWLFCLQAQKILSKGKSLTAQAATVTVEAADFHWHLARSDGLREAQVATKPRHWRWRVSHGHEHHHPYPTHRSTKFNEIQRFTQKPRHSKSVAPSCDIIVLYCSQSILTM